MNSRATSQTNTTRRIISRRLAFAALLLSSMGAFAADVKVVLPTEMKREFLVAPEAPTSVPMAGREFSGKEFSLPVPDSGGFVVVVNREVDTIAWRDSKTITNGVWIVDNSEWRLGTVEIEAKGDMGLLESGIATITVGSQTFDAKVRKGKASFFGLPVGEGELVVKWGQVGAEKATLPQKVILVLDRRSGGEKISVALPKGEGGTPRSKPEEETIDPLPPTEKPAASPWLRWVLILGAVGVALAALVFILRAIGQREGTVTRHLEALGIQVPGDDADPPAAAAAPVSEAMPEPLVPEGSCPYCGQLLDACICKVGAPVVAASTGPRLSADGGTSLELKEGVASIGREGGGCDHELSNATVSRRHAELRVAGTQLFVSDLGSSNGTYVNGSKVESETEVKLGDSVQFGAILMRRDA